MTSTTKRFQWIDRDTAARDLLQLVYHAPKSVSTKALQLLKAIRSTAVIPELQAIVNDTSLDIWQRISAFQAIIATPGDIYMPHIKTYFRPVLNTYDDQFLLLAFSLAEHHPSNQSWLLEYIDQLQPHERFELLRTYSNFEHHNPTLTAALYDRFIQILETNPLLFDLHAAGILHTWDKRPSTQAWLAERWKTLVYLCLTAETRQLVHFLEDWEELRNVVFFCCPIIVLEYHPARAAINTQRARRHKNIDLSQSLVWQDLAKLHAQAQDGDARALENLVTRTRNRDIPTQATAIHFLGKMLPSALALRRLLYLVQSGDDAWKWHDADDRGYYIIYHPVRFEAGEALRNHVTSEVWETLVSTYFDGILENVHASFLKEWIAYQTDILSGLYVQYTGTTWAVENRPWFQALVEEA